MYKVGDTVEIIQGATTELGLKWLPEMDRYVGKTVVVAWSDENSVRIEGDGIIPFYMANDWVVRKEK